MVAASAPVRHVQREHEDGHHSQAEAEDDHHLGHPRLVSVLWVLEVHKDVQVRNNDQDAHDDRDKDEEPVVTLRHGCSYPPGLHLELQAPSLPRHLIPRRSLAIARKPKSQQIEISGFGQNSGSGRAAVSGGGGRARERERRREREREREGDTIQSRAWVP